VIRDKFQVEKPFTEGGLVMAKRILLADDSITIQKVISITFASEDYDLTVVGDGEAAIQKARELKPDLVMADVAMPGKTGYEVCSFVKNDPDLKGTPVLLLAGTFEPLNKDEAIKAGADDSIVKPFESQELLDKVRELLSRAAGPEMAAASRAASAPAEVQASDMWEAGDFLTLPDEFEEKKDDGGVDLDFLSSGALFEADDHKELSLPHEAQDFTDLVIHDEELKPIAEPEGNKFEPLSTEHTFDAGFEGFKEEPARPAFDLSAFELKEEPKKTEAFEVESFDLEPFRPEKKDETIIQPWELPVGEAKIEEKEFAEPDLLEIPEEVIDAAPSPFARDDEARHRSFERSFEAPRPIREVMQPETPKAAQFSEEEVAKTLQRAADKVEERLIEDLNLKLGKAESKVAEAIERAAARVEEKLRADLGQKLEKVDSQVARAIENTVARLEERLKSELSIKLEKSLAMPKEQVEAIVARTSKQVVEHVAWEVLPELAERLIKVEINKVKDAFLRSRT
jgi:DNA-binding response OmpR family regulator